MVIFIKKLMKLKKQQKLNYVECFYFMCFILIQIKKNLLFLFLKIKYKLFLFKIINLYIFINQLANILNNQPDYLKYK